MPTDRSGKRPSVIKEVLRALIPYSKTNLMLSTNPNKFFNYLEQTTGASRQTLHTTLSRAKKDKLLAKDNSNRWSLNWRGRMRANISPPNKLNGTQLLVLFDIPETQKRKRDQLRKYLKSQGFKQLQLSVWTTEYDVRDEIEEVLSGIGVTDYVKIVLARSFTVSK